MILKESDARRLWKTWESAEEKGSIYVPGSNVAAKGGVGSKNDRRAGTHFFEPGGYKIEPLLTKMVNKVNDDI